jgi:hypothetical protein
MANEPQFWNGQRAQAAQIARTGQTRQDRLGQNAPSGWQQYGNALTGGQQGYPQQGYGMPQMQMPQGYNALMGMMQHMQPGMWGQPQQQPQQRPQPQRDPRDPRDMGGGWERRIPEHGNTAYWSNGDQRYMHHRGGGGSWWAGTDDPSRYTLLPGGRPDDLPAAGQAGPAQRHRGNPGQQARLGAFR